MKEQLPRSAELTQRQASSTLNKAHSLPSVGSTMPEPTEPHQPPKGERPERKNPQPRLRGAQSKRPETMHELMTNSVIAGEGQSEREAVRALMGVVKEQGRVLSPEEFQQYMKQRRIAGGDDSPYNDENEGEEAAPRRARRERASIRASDILGDTGDRLHRDIQDALRVFNEKQELNMDFDDLKREHERIILLPPSDPSDPIPNDQRQRLLASISRIAQARQIEIATGPLQRFGFYLEVDALRELDDDPMKWLDRQFDAINEFASKGAELESPVVQRVQTMVSEASSYLQTVYEKFLKNNENESGAKIQLDMDKNSKTLTEFNEIFTVRLNLMYARYAIEQGGMEQIIGSISRLKADGLLGAFSYDNGRVGEMYYRMQSLLDNLRLAEGGKEHHLFPTTFAKLQDTLVEEQVRMAMKGLGVFSDVYIQLGHDPENPRSEETVQRLLRREVVRATNTAKDALIVSQRVAVIAARGEQVRGPQQFYSDVGGAFQKAYNLEASNLVKWDSLNKEEEHFFEFMKLDLAINYNTGLDISQMTRVELLDLGTRIFRDLYAVADFYSGGWRINGFRNQLIEVTRYKLQNNALAAKFLSGEVGDNEELGEVKQKLNERVRDDIAKWEEERNTQARGEDRAMLETRFARAALKENKIITKQQRTLAIQELLHEDVAGIERDLSRIAGVRDSDEGAVADFGLFFQLKQRSGGMDKSNEKTRPVWEKIRKYRAEEMIRLARERARGEIRGDRDTQEITRINNIFRDTDPDLVLSNSEIVYGTDRQGNRDVDYEAFNSYDKFNLKYGGIMRALRKEAMDMPIPTQIDMRHLNEAQKAKVDLFTGKAGDGDRLVRMFVQMDHFIGQNDLIGQFVKSPKYIDIYSRVMHVDDMPLEEMQKPAENSGLQALSQQWSGEAGNDGLKRTMSDTGDALAVSDGQFKFIMTESTEEREKISSENRARTSNYNGRDNGATVMRFNAGTEYLYAMQDWVVDALGIGAWPFRIASAEKQRDYGIGAHTLPREEIRKKLDHLKTEFVGRGPDAAKWFHQMEQLTETDAMGRMKQTSLALLIYAFLGLAVGVPLGSALLAVNEGTK